MGLRAFDPAPRGGANTHTSDTNQTSSGISGFTVTHCGRDRSVPCAPPRPLRRKLLTFIGPLNVLITFVYVKLRVHIVWNDYKGY